MIDPSRVRRAKIQWHRAVRIIRSLYPPVDLFEDIADPADWPLLISAEMKTNPRLMETIGNIDLVPHSRRVSGPGASYLMAPFTHVSPDRPSRFSDGRYGVLYVAKTLRNRVVRNDVPPRTLHGSHRAAAGVDVAIPRNRSRPRRQSARPPAPGPKPIRSSIPTTTPPAKRSVPACATWGLMASSIPASASQGGECAGLFYPDRVSLPTQGRHLDYHWDGVRVDLYRDVASRQVYRVT